MKKRTWMPLKQAAHLLGIKLKTAQNSIGEGTFRLPTYKLGRQRVVDRQVIAKFFELKRIEGLTAIEKYSRRK